MGLPLLLEVFFLIVSLTIGTVGLTLPLVPIDASLITPALNTSGRPKTEICISSLIWTGSTEFDAEFTNHCFYAWRTFLRTDHETYRGIEFEFLQQGAAPSRPGVPTMDTPRRYISGKSTVHVEDRDMSLTIRWTGSCTIAIANLANIPKGILPREPPGPFPRSDLARFNEFTRPMSAVRANCLGRRKELGWAPAGKYTLSGLRCCQVWIF